MSKNMSESEHLVLMREVLGVQGEADTFQIITFGLGNDECGVNILKIQEIIRMVEITKVPRAPEFVEGVINLRGKVIPIIDLRKRFGMKSVTQDKNTRIIVMEISEQIVGIIVDSVSEVLRHPVKEFELPPPTLQGPEGNIIAIGKRGEGPLLIVLDPSKILAYEELGSLGEMNP